MKLFSYTKYNYFFYEFALHSAIIEKEIFSRLMKNVPRIFLYEMR